MEPAVDYLAGDGPPPCFLYFGTFLFVRTAPEGGERQQGGAQAGPVVSVLPYLIKVIAKRRFTLSEDFKKHP